MPGAIWEQSLGAETPAKRPSSHASAVGAHTGYPLILAALKSGQGLSSSSLAGELSVYSGGGYGQIPDAWGASQGRPQT